MDGQFSDVSTGRRHTCALRTDRTIVCWDSALSGEVEAPAGHFTALTSGYGHSCGIRTDGAIECWGDNEVAQADPPHGRFTAVDAGHDHSCAVTVEAAIVCWGRNFHGRTTRLRDGSPLCLPAETLVRLARRRNRRLLGWDHWGETDAPEGRFTAVAAGGGHSCGLRADGTVECWGGDDPAPGAGDDVRSAATFAGDLGG